VYLFPGSDRDAQDAFRLHVGGHLAYEWRFDVVRLWEIDAESALQDGRAGPLALVPLLRGGTEPDNVLAAVRMLDALPQPQSADGMSALLDFAGQRYDRATFWNVLGKDRVMQSWLWQMGRDEGEASGEARGEARGRAEGEAHALRRVCVDLAKEIHPRVAAHVLSAIESCDQPATLRDWILRCPKLSGAEFSALVADQAPVHLTRSRTGRPSRTSRRSVPVRKRR
jgi:hypothetical protein